MTSELERLDKEIAETKEALKDVHGTETEVYARIVGYYRAVRNWNKGKAAEFKERKMFKVDEAAECESCRVDTQKELDFESKENEQLQKTSKKRKSEATVPDGLSCDGKEAWNKYKELASGFRAEVYTKKGCPNCPAVLKVLEDVPFKREYIDVGDDAGLKQAAVHGVMASPTVIFYNGDTEVARCHSAGELEEVFKGVR